MPITSIETIDRQVLRTDALCRMYHELLEELGQHKIDIRISINEQLEQVALISRLPGTDEIRHKVKGLLKRLPISAELV